MKSSVQRILLLALCLTLVCGMLTGCKKEQQQEDVNTVHEVTLSNGEKVRHALSGGTKLTPELAEWAKANEPDLYQQAVDAGLVDGVSPAPAAQPEPQPAPQPEPQPEPAGPAEPTPGREWVGVYLDFAKNKEMTVTWSEDIPDKIKISYVGEVLADFNPDDLTAYGEGDGYSIAVQFEWHAGQYRMAHTVTATNLSTGEVSTLESAEWIHEA